MNTVDKMRSPVHRQLEAYEEICKSDPTEVPACRNQEDAIAVGVNIFQMLAQREQAWREQVFRGVVAFADDDNVDHRGRFANWLDTTKEVLARVLPELERRFAVVEGAAELRRCAQIGEMILLGWQPPRLSRAVGLRDMLLSPEAAVELDRILMEAGSLPQEQVRGSRMPEISADEFLRRKLHGSV